MTYMPCANQLTPLDRWPLGLLSSLLLHRFKAKASSRSEKRISSEVHGTHAFHYSKVA